MKHIVRTAAVSAVVSAALAVSAIAGAGAAGAAPLISEYTLPFAGTSITAARTTEAWVAGTDGGTVRVARVVNGAVSTYDTGVAGRDPSIVASGDGKVWLLPRTSPSHMQDAPATGPLLQWTGGKFVNSTVPTSVTVDGNALALLDIAGSPRAGLQGLFASTLYGQQDLNTVIHVGRWTGSAWELSGKRACYISGEEPLVAYLTSAPDGWVTTCGDLGANTRVDSSGQPLVPFLFVEPSVPDSPAIAAPSAAGFWTFGDEYRPESGWSASCAYVSNGSAARCAAPPERVGSAAATTWNQVYVAGESAFYRFYPGTGRYVKVADGSSLDARLVAAPYSNAVWAVNGTSVFFGS